MRYNIHITQKIEQDYQIEAKSKAEALRIAADRYERGEYNPAQDSSDIMHTIKAGAF